MYVFGSQVSFGLKSLLGTILLWVMVHHRIQPQNALGPVRMHGKAEFWL